MPAIADRVKETTTTTGTGTVTLGGAGTGFRTFSAAIGAGNTCYYTIVDRITGDWEIGIGTVSTSPDRLSRDTILKSSNSNAAVSFASGTKDVFIDIPAAQLGLGQYGGFASDWVFDKGSSGSGIAAGGIRFNKATYASVTEVYIHKTNGQSISVAGFLSTLGAGTYIRIFKMGTYTNNWLYLQISSVVDMTTYYKLIVGYIGASSTFSDGDLVVFSSAGNVQSNVPAGVILPFGMTTLPTGWLECDGTAVSRTTYATLFAAVGTTWGVGDGSTTFNLPNLTNREIRGA